MLWLLFGQRIRHIDFSDYAEKLSRNINLVPFETVKLFVRLAKYSIDSRSTALALRNLFGNVVLFIPLGLLSVMYEKLRSFPKFILTVTAVIVLIEVLQFFTLLGSCDIDDLILNLVGASIGFYGVKLTEKYRKKKEGKIF